MQPPCTDFSLAGACWFAEKDKDGRTDASVRLVREALRWVTVCDPVWWVLENPASRIHKLIPELGSPTYKWSPHQYGENYRKTIWLWGKFTIPPMTTPNAPVIGARPGQPDAWYSKVGGASLATKNYRARASPLFAAEFFKVNR